MQAAAQCSAARLLPLNKSSLLLVPLPRLQAVQKFADQCASQNYDVLINSKPGCPAAPHPCFASRSCLAPPPSLAWLAGCRVGALAPPPSLLPHPSRSLSPSAPHALSHGLPGADAAIFGSTKAEELGPLKGGLFG